MMDACHYTIAKPKECTTPRTNPKVNHGFGVMMMCHCRFILGNILETDVENGECCAWVVEGVT